jgi:hypothetical protein
VLICSLEHESIFAEHLAAKIAQAKGQASTDRAESMDSDTPSDDGGTQIDSGSSGLVAQADRGDFALIVAHALAMLFEKFRELGFRHAVM